nr:aspartate 1-decarboxylase autocleavage activator PanM [Ipomoea batatas]
MPSTRPPIIAPGILPMPPSTAAHAGHRRHRGTNHEGQRNDAIRINAQQAGHFQVFSTGSAGAAHAGIANKQGQRQHGQERHHPDHQLHRRQRGRETIAFSQRPLAVLQEDGHSDGGDQRNQALGRANRPGSNHHKRDIAADHIDLAVGEVDHADNAVNHGVANGDQRVGAPEGDPVEHLLNEIEKLLGHNEDLLRNQKTPLLPAGEDRLSDPSSGHPSLSAQAHRFSGSSQSHLAHRSYCVQYQLPETGSPRRLSRQRGQLDLCGYIQPFRSVACDVRQRGVTHTFWSHKAGFQACRFRLAQNLAQLRVVTTVVHEIHVLFLQTRNQRREIFIARGDTFEHHHVAAFGLQGFLYGFREALAVLLFVMHHSDTFRFDHIQNVVRRRWALVRIQTGGAHHICIATCREFRCRGRGGVVIFHTDQFVAVHAAFGINIFNRLRSAGSLFCKATDIFMIRSQKQHNPLEPMRGFYSPGQRVMLPLKADIMFIAIILALCRCFDLFYCLKCARVPDRIDLGKIWPEIDIEKLETALNESHRLYAARFNDRLLAALQLEISGIHGKVHHLAVRDVTRRRGVGQYLLEETMKQNPSLNDWWIADDGSDDQRFDSHSEFLHRVLFKLSDALCGNAITIGQFLQGSFVVLIQPAGANDMLAALVQAFHCVLILFDTVGKIRGFILEIQHRRHGFTFTAFVISGHIEGHILSGHARFHFPHIFAAHAQFARDHFYFVLIKPAQALLGFTQVKEQLALCFRGRHFHDAPVTQHIFVNFRFNPVYGKGYQTDANFRIKATNGFHQADVTFLNQIALVMQPFSQRLFLFCRQHRPEVYCGVNRRKCCTVASQAATHPIIAAISSNNSASSQENPSSEKVVPNTEATCATTDCKRRTSTSERSSDNTAPEKPNNAPPYRNGRRINPSVAPINFCTLMVSRRAKMLSLTLLPITRNTATIIKIPIMEAICPTSPVSAARRANQLSSMRTSSTPFTFATLSRSVCSVSEFWKVSLGVMMTTAGRGFCSSISIAPPKPDQLRNSFRASSRVRTVTPTRLNSSNRRRMSSDSASSRPTLSSAAETRRRISSPLAPEMISGMATREMSCPLNQICPALGRSMPQISFSKGNTGQTDRFMEQFGLADGILPGAGINCQHDFMRRLLIQLFHDARNFLQFFHQVRFVLQTACGVGD